MKTESKPSFSTRRALCGALLSLAGISAVGCGPLEGPRTDSQTNWYRACEDDAQCGGLSCLCGVCTHACEVETTCADLEGARCVVSSEVGSIALCGGRPAGSAGLCAPRCDDTKCAKGQMCVANVCAPVPDPIARVTVDTSIRHQALVGFGATLAYIENDVFQHPRQSALYEAIFSGLGLDLLRLRNHHGYPNEGDLAAASEIVGAGRASLGRQPTVLLTSWSPPATLKENGALQCAGNPETCTLARGIDGRFDYAGFAEYWRAALEAYAEVGVTADYISIQNNPDFVPDANAPGEACRFLPVEGTTTVSVGGAAVEVEYPGFAEALTAVVEDLEAAGLDPKIIAPDTSHLEMVADYASTWDLSNVDAIGHHMYGTDPATVDLAALAELGELGQISERPVLQTEMDGDGLDTAVSAHYALTVEKAAGYVQGVLVRRSSSVALRPGALIALGPEDFALEDPYHALRHYAFHTDPGWTRVGASSDAGLLASAWLSPAADALTLVLVNPEANALDTRIELGESMTNSAVTRTTFDGVERSQGLGALSPEGILHVPAHSIITIALSY